MRISEQARKAASRIRNPWDINDAEIIQTAINDHERDLVEAAREALGYIESTQNEYGRYPIDPEDCDGYPALKAALERRKE